MTRQVQRSVIVWLGIAAVTSAQGVHGRSGIVMPAPPAAQVVPVVDNYFGTKLTDNYRWLEDARSSETRAFIDAENAYTARYMKQARMRPDVVDDLDALERVSHWTIPVERGGNFYFTKRLAGEEQASIYLRKGGAKPGAPAQDQRLVDPARLSRDTNTSVSLADVSRDGALVAYSVRKGGSDDTEIHFLNVAAGKTLEDELPAADYYSACFTPDAKAVYYARNNSKGTLLYLHQLGTRNSDDVLIFGREFHGEELGPNDAIWAEITDDARYLVVYVARGTPARRVDIVFRDLKKPNDPFVDLVWGVDAQFWASYAQGEWIVKTNFKAPNWRILRADPGIYPDAWKTVVAEGAEPIEESSVVGGKIYVNRLKDVKPEISVYSLDGKAGGGVGLDGIGWVSEVRGRTTDRYAYFNFQSLLVPPTIYRLDTATGRREVFAQVKVPFDSSQYELKQEFYTSKDGTRIPIFIAGKKGLKRDGTERLLMTGYGGFQVSMLPYWSPEYAWWLQQGGWFALPNLRGGNEYGERWHEQAMFEKKQNVFDDWFAAAQYLIDRKYTAPQRLAITGSSNGGLLMGASITQRPELFAAVVCAYPLLDMLRFQKFLQGSHWTSEYGSVEKEKDFFNLLKYSPYHHVTQRTDYPAVLFFTGDSDTRVDPLHARKMTAMMQSASRGPRPVLLHYSLSGGHSAGVGVEQQIQDDADQMTFLWTETGPATMLER